MALPFYGSLPGNPFPRPNPQDNPEKGKQQICTLTATKATMASSIYVSVCVRVWGVPDPVSVSV